MSYDDEEDVRQYAVVVNDEEQYSIWLADRELPSGWRHAGKGGTKPECLKYIDEVWTDMRPLSLRRKMEAITPAFSAPGPDPGDRADAAPTPQTARPRE
jgi:MbtH protein